MISRDDDRLPAIRSRLSEYREKVLPVVEAYRERGILKEVDASPSIEDVWDEVQKVLERTAGEEL